jgi:hypothetical protein
LRVKAGSVTSSIRYKRRREGNAMATKIKAGKTVQIISII